MLRDPAVDIDAFAHVQQRAVLSEKPVDAAAARQCVERLTFARESDVLACLGHLGIVFDPRRKPGGCPDFVAFNRRGLARKQTAQKYES
jgi:hypothetical protein